MTPSELALAGSGAGIQVWTDVLTAVTGLAAARRRSGQAASAGAALLAGRAAGLGWQLDLLDPVVARAEPDPVASASYRRLRERADRLAGAALDLDGVG